MTKIKVLIRSNNKVITYGTVHIAWLINVFFLRYGLKIWKYSIG